MGDEDTPTPTDWDNAPATILTGIPLDALDALDAPVPEPAPTETTAPHSLRELPGFDPGVRRGHDEALMAFRLAMIEGKDGKRTDPGVAFLLEQNLRRWMQVPENAELIREMLKR